MVGTQKDLTDARFRERVVLAARDEMKRTGGVNWSAFTATWGVSRASVEYRWLPIYEELGLRGLMAGKSTGRKPRIKLSDASAIYLRRLYVKSNRATGRGSMTSAARYAARTHDADNPLTAEERQAILACGRSKHNLSVSIRRAMRGATALTAEYRDPRTMALGGAYAPGTIRMTVDPETGASRRLHAGERWCGDDGSINLVVCVPWPWGGDACSDRYGVRVGRYQLIPILDVRNDKCVAWSYTMRSKDSFRGDDLVAIYDHAFHHCGYAPKEMVSEGGAFQSRRVVEYLRQAGVEVIDAKGRPHQKVIEPWFGRLWTQLSLRTGGQIGRYRGEMKRETDLFMKARAGSIDPRRCFPSLEEAMNAVEWAIQYLNGERVESPEYGVWIPDHDYAESLAAHPRPAYTLDLGYLGLRERARVKVCRFDSVAAMAESPLGTRHRYKFASPELLEFNGAWVWLHFDPMAVPVQATITLADRFEDHPAGVMIARHVPCLNSAPEMIRDAAGIWSVGWSDGVAATIRAKKLAHLAVRRELRALSLDGNRVAAISEISAPDGITKQLGIAAAAEQAAREEADVPQIMSRLEMVAS